MANISTENINTLAQVAASVKDGDYIYIYKAASGEFSRVELSVFLQQMSAGSASSSEIQAIKNNMQTLLDALADIAFLYNRPTFDWSGDGGGGGDEPPVVTNCSITQNLTNIDSSFLQNTIVKGNRLLATLSVKDSLTPSDMYVIDDDNVVVTMGGNNITANVYTPATGVIDIPKVTGDVVITASAITYVSTGLVFMLDGKHQGSTQGVWANLINENYPLVLTGDGYTRNSDHIAFDGGTSGSTMANGIVEDFGFANTVAASTSEAVIMPSSGPTNAHHVIFITGRDDGTIIGTSYLNGTNEPCMFSVTNVDGDGTNYNAAKTGLLAGTYSANQIISISHYGTSFKLNGENLAQASDAKPLLIGGASSSYNMNGRFSVCGFTSRNDAYTFPYSGNIYCIRLYNRELTPEEVMQNYRVDKKRFNIS